MPRFELSPRELLLAALLLAVTLFLLHRHNNQLAVLAILYLTFLAVVWYTQETHLLRLQQIRPYVLLLRFGDNDYRFVNVGNGTALNVRVANARTAEGPLDIRWQFVQRLKPGEETTRIYFRKDHDAIIDAIFDAVKHEQPEHFFEATVEFEDVEGHAYDVGLLFKIENNEVVTIVKSSRRR